MQCPMRCAAPAALAFRTPLLSLVTLLALAPVHAADGTDGTAHYAIRLKSKVIGYAVHSTQQREVNGRPVKAVKATTFLKIALLGKERKTRLESETIYDADTQRLRSYRFRGASGDDVRRIECELQGNQLKLWAYADGKPRGDAKTFDFTADTVLVGGNNFAHWQRLAGRLARSKEGKVKLSVLVPDLAQSQSLQFVQHAQKSLSHRGKKLDCRGWKTDKGEMVLWIDEASQRLVRMELKDQQTTIELADQSVVKQAEKAEAEELMARHFARTTAEFDDYLKVRRMVADVRVKVIGSGVGNPPDVLTNAMQKFKGKKDGASIVGRVEIESRTVDPTQTPAFPTVDPKDQALAAFLKEEAYIECLDADVAAQAERLTKGATTRWEAVLRIGRWVEKELRYKIADTPSAKLALKKREGDCGPHSTLTVAMLRSVNIPARLVGGLLFTSSFGGSFGQHAWVEVHLGKQGWTAIDPTTGEFETLSATHIKLFEGMGGVLPEKIEVREFSPPNRAKTVRQFRTRPLPWKLDKEYQIGYRAGSTVIGFETFRLRKLKRDGRELLELTSSTSITVAVLLKQTSKTTLLMEPNGRPVSFFRTHSVPLQTKTTVKCEFAEGKVRSEVRGAKTLDRTVDLPPACYCFDNNLVSSFMVLCSQLPLDPKQPLKVRTFHPSSLQLLPLKFEIEKEETIKIGNREVRCYRCAVAPIKNTFWITPDGKLVKVAQGRLVLQLKTLD